MEPLQAMGSNFLLILTKWQTLQANGQCSSTVNDFLLAGMALFFIALNQNILIAHVLWKSKKQASWLSKSGFLKISRSLFFWFPELSSWASKKRIFKKLLLEPRSCFLAQEA